MELAVLKCKQCHWQGTPNEVDWELIETCMGTDKTEICPNCGSMEIYLVSNAI